MNVIPEHSVACYPTRVKTPRSNPSQKERRAVLDL